MAILSIAVLHSPDRRSFRRCTSAAAVALVWGTLAGCAHQLRPAAAVEAEAPLEAGGPLEAGAPLEAEAPLELREGVYASCDGAYAHREWILLRDGAFEHLILSHGRHGGRSTGTYAVVGDTVVVAVEQTRPVADVPELITLEYDFVVGRHAGHDVLWRGRAATTRAVATGQISDYAALFHAGSDPADLDEPSCGDVRDRLKAAGSSHP